MFTFVVLGSFNLPNLIRLKILFPDSFFFFWLPASEAWSINHWTAKEVPSFQILYQISYSDRFLSSPCIYLFLAPPSLSRVPHFPINKNLLHINLDFSANIVSSLGSLCNTTFRFPHVSCLHRRPIFPLDHDPMLPMGYSSHRLYGVPPSIIHFYLICIFNSSFLSRFRTSDIMPQNKTFRFVSWLFNALFV